MQAWVFFVILGVFAVGMAWGFMVGRSKNTSLRRAEQLDIELHELRGQTSEYKQQVSQHFAKTAPFSTMKFRFYITLRKKMFLKLLKKSELIMKK